jgi:hypothetical protein
MATNKNKAEAKSTLIKLVQHWFESAAETKYKVSTHHNYTTTKDKWFINTPKKANTLSENWVKKYFTITFDGHAALGRTEYFSQKAKQLNNY